MNMASASDAHDFSHYFEEGMHLCYIFSDDQERTATLSKLLASSLASRQKVLNIIDTTAPPDLAAGLAREGCDSAAASRDIVTLDNESAYCPGGKFDPIGLLEGAASFCRQAADEGYLGARVCGDMSWVIRKHVPMADLMAYERRVNHYTRAVACTALCEYDARKFDGATIMDVLRVHPAIIVGTQVVMNPYFVPPGQLMDEAT